MMIDASLDSDDGWPWRTGWPGAYASAQPVPEDTAAELILAARDRYSDRVVYIEDDVSTTLRSHLADSERFAAWLHARFGVGPGDRVAVLSPTSRAYIALWHAALLGHFTLVPLNFRLAPLELAEVLGNADPKVVIYASSLSELAMTAVADVPHQIPVVSLETIQAEAEPGALAGRTIEPAEVAVIMYTSGTTGIPKGVEMTQRALARTNTRQHHFWDIKKPGTCLYTTTPLFHVSAIFAVLGPVLEGNPTVIAPIFDIDRLIEDSRRYRLTHMALVSVMITRFLEHPAFRKDDHKHIRYIIYGGSPVPSQTIAGLTSSLPDTELLQSYGMTEALGASTCLTGEDHLRGGARLLSCGKVLPGVEIRIRGADGSPCETGVSGEIELRSDALFRGYRGNPEATAAAFEKGWYRSGDVGRIDEDGYIYIVDRLKDMIITGGENVYSAEVEHALYALPGIAQVAVIGVPSAVWGEQVHAVIVPQAGVVLDAKAVSEQLRKRLASYKCPKSYEFRDEPLPIAGTNKINKRALREQYRARTGATVA